MSNPHYKQSVTYSFCPSVDKFYPELDIGLIYAYSGELIPNTVCISGYYCANKLESNTATFNEESKKWEWTFNTPEIDKLDKFFRSLDEAFSRKGLSDCILEYLNKHGTPFDSIIKQNEQKNLHTQSNKNIQT